MSDLMFQTSQNSAALCLAMSKGKGLEGQENIRKLHLSDGHFPFLKNQEISSPWANKDAVKVEEGVALCDILDGSEPIRDTKEMHLRFMEHQEHFGCDHAGAVMDELSFCLSGFYDGDKLHKRSNDNLWLLEHSSSCDNTTTILL
jgi:hypothetical protein